LTVPSTFTLNCTGVGGAAAQTTTVTIAPEPTVTLTALQRPSHRAVHRRCRGAVRTQRAVLHRELVGQQSHFRNAEHRAADGD
jgi:hypothetical protein